MGRNQLVGSHGWHLLKEALAEHLLHRHAVPPLCNRRGLGLSSLPLSSVPRRYLAHLSTTPVWWITLSSTVLALQSQKKLEIIADINCGMKQADVVGKCLGYQERQST